MRSNPCVFRPARIVLVVLLLPALLAGCSPRSKVLATVGSQTITVDDFETVARGAQLQYGGMPDSARSLLYQDLVRRALLLEYAVTQHKVIDSLVVNYRRGVEDNVLRGALFERQVPRTVPVSEGELRQLYAWQDSVTRLQIIYTVEKRLADAAMQALHRGEDFTEVANRFNLVGMLPPGGILDDLAPGSLVKPLDDVLRTGRPHEVIGPLDAPGEGWFIVRVLSRRANQRPPFEEQSITLQQGLEQRKRRLVSLHAYQWLRDAYHVTVDPAGAHSMFDRYNRLPNGQPIGDAGPAPPTPEDLRQVLARYQGADGDTASYTLADALEDLRTDTRDRPNPAMLPSFTQWIESHAVQHAALIEARRRHLDQEPAIAKDIRERVNNYIVESIYEAEVLQQSTVNEQDLRAAYTRHAQSFVRVGSATIEHVLLPDSISAARLVERARTAASLRDAMAGAAPGLQPREELVRYPSRDSVWTNLRGALRGMRPGDLGAPIRTARGWRVYRLVSKEMGMEPYETLPPNIQQALHEEATEQARERRLIDLTNWLRRTIPVTEHRERLKEIHWPLPALNGFSG
jgi:parvulin-like peptidyl-prolyl isomerase